VQLRIHFMLAGVLALPVLAPAAPPGEPNPLGLASQEGLAANNQKMAQSIAEQLRQSGWLRHYQVEVVYHQHTVYLSGTVADQPQREEVLRIVQGFPGVDKVLDSLQVIAPITRVQAEAPPGKLPLDKVPDGPVPPMPPADGPGDGKPPVFPPPPTLNPAPPAGVAPPAAGAAPGNGVTEPVPIFQAPPMGPTDLNGPRMPPYAWPTYAPYNNYSRVAYPTAYPYNAWPYIGPCYPFPKIPLGWRSVKLEWDDGYWWFSRTANKWDWWRLRFW